MRGPGTSARTALVPKTPPTTAEWQAFAAADVAVVSYPYTLADTVRELRRKGVRVLPYVSFYKAPDVAQIPESQTGKPEAPARSECLRNPFWSRVALSPKRSGWLTTSAAPLAGRSKMLATQPAGTRRPLPSRPIARCLEGLEALLADGFAACFSTTCTFSHRPEHTGQATSAQIAVAMVALTQEASAAVHAGGNRLLIVNGERPAAIQGAIDAYCSRASLQLGLGPLGPRGAWEASWREACAAAATSGVGPQPVAISYLGFTGRFPARRCVRCPRGGVGARAGRLRRLHAADPSLMVDFARRNLFQGGQKSALSYTTEEAPPSPWIADYYSLRLGAALGPSSEREDVRAVLREGGVLVQPTLQLRTVPLPELAGRPSSMRARSGEPGGKRARAIRAADRGKDPHARGGLSEKASRRAGAVGR